MWNTIKNVSAFLRKLSLKAEKNWHQNSGEKRRDSSKGVDIGKGPQFAREPGCVPGLIDGSGQSGGSLSGPANRATDYSGAVKPVVREFQGIWAYSLPRSMPIRRRSAFASSMRLTSLPLSWTSRMVLVSVMQDWISITIPMAR